LERTSLTADRRVRRDVAGAGQHGDAVDVGKQQVEDDQREPVALEGREPASARVDRLDAEAGGRQDTPEDHRHLLLVLDDEHLPRALGNG
jgi:hypothetical protein